MADSDNRLLISDAEADEEAPRMETSVRRLHLLSVKPGKKYLLSGAVALMLVVLVCVANLPSGNISAKSRSGSNNIIEDAQVMPAQQGSIEAFSPTKAPAAAAALPFDCNAGFAKWEAGWSAQKKTWCCETSGKACPVAAGAAAAQPAAAQPKPAYPLPAAAEPAFAATPAPAPVAPTYLVPPGTRVENGYMLVGPVGHQHWVVAPTAVPPTTLPPCHTAEKGSTCYSGVVWAKYTGINLHPSWFPGLSVNSTFEEFQKALAAKGEKDCTLPCDTNTNLTNRLPWGKPSFFCWSVARPGYEMEILKTQIDHGAGIFACEEQAIFSQTKMTVGGWPPVDTIFISNVKTGISQDGTSANSAIFQQAWHVVKSDGRYNNHDFTVKADPDAIIFPWRLRTSLASHVNANVFVRNCNKVPGSPNFPMMFGSVEILSKAAVNAYLANEAKCKTLPWQGWGEDFFLTKCLQMIGVSPIDDFGIVRDGACNGLWCGDKHASAFHPLKSVDAWMKCHDEAQ